MSALLNSPQASQQPFERASKPLLQDWLAHVFLAIACLGLHPWPAPPDIKPEMAVRMNYSHPATARFLVQRWAGRTGRVIRASTAGQYNLGGQWVIDLDPTDTDPRRREIQCSGIRLLPLAGEGA